MNPTTRITNTIVQLSPINAPFNDSYTMNLSINIILKISDDINLDFTENGLYTQALGVNHVCLVELMIDKNWFTNYVIDKPCSLGINCEVFYSILSCLEKENSFHMLYDDGDTLNINIKP